MGLCEFCFKGLRHPKATRQQLAKERGREMPDRGTPFSPTRSGDQFGVNLSLTARIAHTLGADEKGVVRQQASIVTSEPLIGFGGEALNRSGE
jgi:hypothetical protein